MMINKKNKDLIDDIEFDNINISKKVYPLMFVNLKTEEDLKREIRLKKLNKIFGDDKL